MGSSSSDTNTSTKSSSAKKKEPTKVTKEPVSNKQSEQDNNIQKNKEEIKHPCCVCKETRGARDLCFAEKAPNGFEECFKEIKAHKECMKSEGFNV